MSKNPKEELCRKLKTLAERGVGGERINAEAQLKKLMEKYGITHEDLELGEYSERIFMVGTDKNLSTIFAQVVLSCFSDREPDIFFLKRDRKYRMVKCTPMQKIEIEAKFAFFKRRFKEDLDVFVRAFVYKNNLYSAYTKPKKLNEVSQKERERYEKAVKMAGGLDQSFYRKQLTS